MYHRGGPTGHGGRTLPLRDHLRDPRDLRDSREFMRDPRDRDHDLRDPRDFRDIRDSRDSRRYDEFGDRLVPQEPPPTGVMYDRPHVRRQLPPTREEEYHSPHRPPTRQVLSV